MKQYIDGKDNQINWYKYPFGAVVKAYMKYYGGEPVEHKKDGIKHRIPITYYKPLTLYPKNGGSWLLQDMDNLDNLKWIDGQPYELIVLNGKV